jgi:uncharacterized membrane protein YbhN (UPF0104 family)
VIAVIRRPGLLRRLTEPCVRGWLKLRPCSAVRSRAEALIAELREVNPTMRFWVPGIVFAFANWAADLLCLLVACRAVGVQASIDTMVVAYAIGMAAAADLVYRSVSFGLIAIIGWGVYAVQRRGPKPLKIRADPGKEVRQ